MKIAFVGGPGLGKTTLCLEVTAALKKKSVIACHVSEFARTWTAKAGHPPRNVEDQGFIMRGQMRRENEAALTQEVVVTDSTTWMCFVYSTNYMRSQLGSISEVNRMHICDLFDDALGHLGTYNMTFYIPRCFEPQIEGVLGRHQRNREEMEYMDKKILGMAHVLGIPYIMLPADKDLWFPAAMKHIGEGLGLVKPAIPA